MAQASYLSPRFKRIWSTDWIWNTEPSRMPFVSSKERKKPSGNPKSSRMSCLRLERLILARQLQIQMRGFVVDSPWSSCGLICFQVRSDSIKSQRTKSHKFHGQIHVSLFHIGYNFPLFAFPGGKGLVREKDNANCSLRPARGGLRRIFDLKWVQR
jgi:hypothetical protein